ncbi:DUF6192 family protein [Streptomyces asoensis]|uniref:DUF6192 family protein n=1 Tax=Streptomyces asoensis TaxID=249586 RepID=UPI0033DC7758
MPSSCSTHTCAITRLLFLHACTTLPDGGTGSRRRRAHRRRVGGQVTASLPSRSETASALPAADRVRVVQGLTRGDEVGSHATSELPRRPRAGVHMAQTRAVTRKAKAATMMATRT